jgi:TonB family protein
MSASNLLRNPIYSLIAAATVACAPQSWADPASAPQDPQPSAPNNSASPASTQSSSMDALARRAHPRTNCVAPESVEIPDNAATIFKYTVTQTGDVKDVSLVRSSGNDDLDNAALKCWGNYPLAPTTSAGKPVDATRTEGYFWTHMRPTFASANPNGSPNLCQPTSYPVAAIRDRAEGDTIVTYVIAMDGSVKDVAVKQSSGNADLDRTTVDCLSGWRFYPVTQNGQAIEVDGVVRMRWRL